MIARGVNSAVTRKGGETLLDVVELLKCLTRSERIRLIKMIEHHNEEEKRAQLKPRPKKITCVHSKEQKDENRPAR